MKQGLAILLKVLKLIVNMFIYSCCTTEGLSDEEDDDDDLDDFEEDESSQASTSTNATTTDQGVTSSSASSKHSHSHPNAHHHPCGNKPTCEEKNGKECARECSDKNCGEGGKNHSCLCCYCEMFGHGGPSAAPVSKNYPEMRERLRLLLSKKKKNKQSPQHEMKIQEEGSIQIEKLRKSSSSSISSSKSSSLAKSKTENKSSKLSTTNENAVAGLAAMSKRNESYARSQYFQKTMPNEEEKIPCVSHNKRAESTHYNEKVHLSQSSSKSSVAGNSKSNLNQQIQQNPLNKSATTGNVINVDQRLSKSSSHNLSNISMLTEQESKIKDVDELLDYIEGNQKAVANDKKKAKKERQKQQRIEELRKKEEEDKRRKEEQEKERRRIEEEKKKQEEEERLRFKKMNKKAAQKAKKLAAKGYPVPSTDDKLIDNSKLSNNLKVNNQEQENNLDPIETLENLKAQHLKELQQLQLLHRQQLEEEHKKLVKKQEEQISLQRKQQVQGKLGQASNKDKKKGKNNSKNGGKNMEDNSTLKISNSVQASAYKTLAEAAQNPGNQIKITRMPNGGVEFSTVPANQDYSPESLPTSTPQMVGKSPAPPPYLQEIFSKNPSIQPNIPSNMIPKSPHGTKNESENNRPCVPSQSNQPMVTIRRVESSNGSDPTVTISMKPDQLNLKNNIPNVSNSGQDKLLYTLVNGKILKPGNTPNNLAHDSIPQSSFSQNRPMNTTERSSTVNSSYSANTMKSARPPLPLDSNGKVDLNRLELPSGISITKVEGQAPERKYFPSKPSENHDQNILPLPGQHESQRGVNSNLANSRTNNINQLSQSPYSVNSVGQYNIPGIGPTNPNNVIVVDTSSLAESSSSKKASGIQNSEKANKKSKKKSKLSQQQQNKPEPSPSPQPARKIPLSPSAHPQQQRSNMQQNKSSQNIERRVPTPASNASIPGDLKSGPQVLIKNINGRVVITPVSGSGTGSPPKDAVSNKSEQNKLEKSKSTPDASKTAARTEIDKNKSSPRTGHSEVCEESKHRGFQTTAGPQNIHKLPNISSNNKCNQVQLSTSSGKSEILHSNGIDSICITKSSKNESVKASYVNENRGNECLNDETLKPIHNKLSKSVNDVENVGGRKRSKKNSIGDNLEDLSK